MADVSTWSPTAASNNTASPDGWPESMAPSGVNNSARENMAQIATWRQKFGGWMMENVGLSATVGGGDLTVTLRVKDGSSSPSSTNKVGIGFRNATLTTGGFTYVEATSGINVTLPSGGTLGFANSATGYIFVYAINNAGTMELALAGSSYFDEGIVYSTTGIGTGSDSSNVLYSTSGRADVPIRLIGRITIQHGTASWTNSPTVVSAWSLPSYDSMSLVTGSYTGTLTGYASPPTVTIYYRKIGPIVTLGTLTSVSGTSNAASLTITGAPAAIRPSNLVGAGCLQILDNGATQVGNCGMNSIGTLTFSKGDSSGFTASGSKGVSMFSLQYITDN